MEKDKRIAIRLSAPLHRMLQREADKQGITLSEHLRRLLLASRPHIPVLEDVEKIIEAGEDVTDLEGSMPYIVNMLQRLEEGLDALNTFDANAMQWRKDAERELRAWLTYVRQRLQEFESLREVVRILQKHQGEGEP